MRLRNPRLSAFGLNLIVALSVLALGAAGAQASGEFLILEGGVSKTFLEHGITSESITGSLEEPGNLTIAGLGTEVRCTAVTPANATAQRHGLILGSLLYTGCTVLETSALLHELPCAISDRGGDQELGKIKTNLIHGLVFLHNAKSYVLIKPDPPGTVFVEVELKGAECPVSGLYPVAGSTILLITAGHALDLLLTPVNNPTLFLGDRLRFGERNATLSGSAVALLTGALVGKQWGAF